MDKFESIIEMIFALIEKAMEKNGEAPDLIRISLAEARELQKELADEWGDVIKIIDCDQWFDGKIPIIMPGDGIKIWVRK